LISRLSALPFQSRGDFVAAPPIVGDDAGDIFQSLVSSPLFYFDVELIFWLLFTTYRLLNRISFNLQKSLTT
jgi:hypothetical protein